KTPPVPASLEIENLALDHSEGFQVPRQLLKPPRHKSGDKFLKGPIPWNWITAAAKPKGKVLHVAMALWFLAGVKRSRKVKFSVSSLDDMGVDRFAAARALSVLEGLGLVSVVRKSGRKAIVTLQEAKTSREDAL